MDTNDELALRLQSYKDFWKFIYDSITETTDEEFEELYNENIEIEFNHQSIRVPFDAVSAHELLNFVETMIKEF